MEMKVENGAIAIGHGCHADATIGVSIVLLVDDEPPCSLMCRPDQVDALIEALVLAKATANEINAAGDGQ